MASNRNLLVLPGDGIGPEVMNEVRKIIAWMGKKRAVGFDIKEDVVGGAALDKHGVPLSDDAMKTALEADAVLFGSVGGPKWDNVEFNKKPERGLLRLRKEMDLFANLRPAKVFDALIDASSLKPEIVKGLDIMIIRELTSGVYFGEPRGRHTNAKGEVEAFDTQRYTASEIRRVCAVAFELARKRMETDFDHVPPLRPLLRPHGGRGSRATRHALRRHHHDVLGRPGQLGRRVPRHAQLDGDNRVRTERRWVIDGMDTDRHQVSLDRPSMLGQKDKSVTWMGSPRRHLQP